MDFGDLFLQVLNGFVLPFFDTELTFFGLSATVGSFLAWFMIGLVVVNFIKALGS